MASLTGMFKIHLSDRLLLNKRRVTSTSVLFKDLGGTVLISRFYILPPTPYPETHISLSNGGADGSGYSFL